MPNPSPPVDEFNDNNEQISPAHGSQGNDERLPTIPTERTRRIDPDVGETAPPPLFHPTIARTSSFSSPTSSPSPAAYPAASALPSSTPATAAPALIGGAPPTAFLGDGNPGAGGVKSSLYAGGRRKQETKKKLDYTANQNQTLDLDQYPASERIRNAGTTISLTCTDPSQRRHYEIAWKEIIKTLQSEEPILRCMALKSAMMGSRSMRHTLLVAAKRVKLFQILTNMAGSDEVAVNRALSAILLGECIPMILEEYSTEVLDHPFKVVLSQFLLYFPNDVASTLQETPGYFERSNYVSSSVMQFRVQYLRAIGYFLRHPQATTVLFMNYIDFLFASLLRAPVHRVLQCEVLHLINEYLPVTNRNRLRVETAFREPISELSHGRDDTATAKAKADNLPLPPLVALMKLELSKFWSIWYTKVGDLQIVNIVPNPEDTARLDGYVKRRREWLMIGAEPVATFQPPRIPLTGRRASVATTNAGAIARRKSVAASISKGEIVGSLATNREDKSWQEAALRKGRRRPYQYLKTVILGNVKFFMSDSVSGNKALKIHPGNVTSGTDADEPSTIQTTIDALTNVPDPSVITFNLAQPAMIQFNRYPFKRDIFLQNRSVTTAIPFTLQISPPEFFNVFPSYGVVEAGSSIVISVDFEPKPHLVQKTPEVNGYLRIRSKEGFALERISLRGYNLPMVKISHLDLDFGICGVSETRSLYITIRNLTALECNFAIAITQPTPQKLYSVTPAQATLAAKERRQIRISFSPTVEGSMIGNMVITTMGGEIHRVVLRATCGVAVQVLDSKLDFGPTDIYYGAMVKKLLVRSMDPSRSLPLLFSTSTDELLVNYGEPVILKPLEDKKIPIWFLSNMPGYRQEKLTIETPDSPLVSLDILSQCQTTVSVPVGEDIFFLPTYVGKPATVRIPIMNFSNAANQVLITLPKNSPFSMRLLDPETANKRSTGLLIEAKLYESMDIIGIAVTIGPRLTAVTEITFVCKAPGLYRIPMTTQTVKPRKWTVSTHYLCGSAISMTQPQSPTSSLNPYALLRKFLRKPISQPCLSTVDVSKVEDMPPMSRNSPEFFRLDPPSLLLSGDIENPDFYEVVTLINVSDVGQDYHVCLSHPFATNVPLDGKIASGASLRIAIFIVEGGMQSHLGAEYTFYETIGFLAVFGNDETKCLATCKLNALVGPQLVFDLRKGANSFRLPPSKVMEKVSRQFVLRNRGPTAVEWKGKLSLTSGGKSKPGTAQASVADNERCPFSLQPSGEISLKPWEWCLLEVTFQSTSTGNTGCQLSMTWIRTTDSPNAKTPLKPLELESLTFRATSGLPELSTVPESIHFGDILIGGKSSKTLEVSNGQNAPGNALVVAPVGLNILLSPWIAVSEMSSTNVEIVYSPKTTQSINSIISVVHGGITHPVPVTAAGGFSQLSTNLAVPLKLDPNATTEPPVVAANVIDFGLVNQTKPKTIPLVLSNSGTFEMNIKGIAVDDERILSWRFEEETNSPQNVQFMLYNGWNEFGSEKLEDLEIDWDEVDQGKAQGDTKTPAKADKLVKKRTVRKPAGGQRDFNFGTASRKALFPIRLLPHQKLAVLLSFTNSEKGSYKTKLRVDVELSNQESESYQLVAIGTVQPPLHLQERKIEFGVRAVHGRHAAELRFTNLGTVKLPWALILDETKYTLVGRPENRSVFAAKTEVSSPLEVFPSEGTLQPGCTQLVDVVFRPNLPQHDVSSRWLLRTEDFSEAPILIHGIGASSKLVCSANEHDFGVLRVGSSKNIHLKLQNLGILQCRYFVECNNHQFSADPEQGLLEGDGKIDVVLKFLPTVVGSQDAIMRILPQSQEIYALEPITLLLKGSASYPQLSVLTDVVDFGIALFGNANVRPIGVRNSGAADAQVVFQCYHPHVRLEYGESGHVVVPGNTTKQVNVVYTPNIVETLDVKVYIRSSDSRATDFVVNLKGTVGVPRLTFDPPDLLKDLDFGVHKMGSSHSKTFPMKNNGNINLSFSFTLVDLAVEDETDVWTDEQISARKDMFDISPRSGTMAVGDVVDVTVTFRPVLMEETAFRVELAYDFRSVVGLIRGIGGRAILQIVNPLRLVDFGLCRLHRRYVSEVIISNKGNFGVEYKVRPEPPNMNWNIYASDTPSANDGQWAIDLEKSGLRLLNPDGYCTPESKTALQVEYYPRKDNTISSRIRVYFGEHFEDIDIRGRAATPKLVLCDHEGRQTHPGQKNAVLNLGIHPINFPFSPLLRLVNEGPFGIDYLIQPVGVQEFEISPIRGYVESNSSMALKTIFRPTTENDYYMTLKVMWELAPIILKIVASGGVGHLEIRYSDEKDQAANGLDFGMVPFNSAAIKRFWICNVGHVDVTLGVNLEGSEFLISSTEKAVALAKLGQADTAQPAAERRKARVWMTGLKQILGEQQCIEVQCKFVAKAPATITGSINITSDCSEITIPLKGKGGTISITHKGDLSFGDIAANFTYSRKIIVVNSGSISSPVTFEWAVVGHSGESSGALITLNETFSGIDPRSGWARQVYMNEKSLTGDVKLSGEAHWRLIQKMIIKNKEDALFSQFSTDKPNKNWGDIVAQLLYSKRNAAGADAGSSGASAKSRTYNADFLKRRQMFFHLISSTNLTSQSLSTVKPFLRVDPAQCVIPSFGELELTVSLNLSTEDTFLGTLLLKTGAQFSVPYEISVTATPKIVNIICDDMSTLNFYRQPMGETELMQKSFTNIGHKEINYVLRNENAGLSIFPAKGTLKVNQTVLVNFTFKPMDESIQSKPIFFEPDCSQTIKLKFWGAGGHARISLSKYRRFDFGHCMIGKDTISYLPIANEGNALLHLTRFDLSVTDTYFKGPEWPNERLSLQPGTQFNLPIVFNPHEDTPPSGRLTIGTNSESWDIKLVGVGREAVLIVTKVAIDFSECIVGNRYERKLGLKNVGDVNYPVKFNLATVNPDVEFAPSALIISPFSDSGVVISYKPTKSCNMINTLNISSPYSQHSVPISLHSGVAMLEFSTTTLDFGMFEKKAKPSMSFTVKNTGTVRTSYSLKMTSRPPLFYVTGSKGILAPKQSAEVTVTYMRQEVSRFEEKLIIRSDLADKIYTVTVVGRCEEAAVHPSDFETVNLGICPVLEYTTKSFELRNFGAFPLTYSIEFVYPIKVSPTAGQISGGEAGMIDVTWHPSGGYELRSHLQIITNIGTFDVNVRGKASFPEMAIKNAHLDFGVCAVGYQYSNMFTLSNKGKVAFHWSIPAVRDCFSTSESEGDLEPKCNKDITVLFKPSAIGRFSNSFVVECRGLNFKEVAVVGVGGNMKLEINPVNVVMNQCPCDYIAYGEFTLTNNGDVTLYLRFESEKPPGSDASGSKDCRILVPAPLTLKPNRSTKCIFGVTALVVGQFSGQLAVISKEKRHTINISGLGLKVHLRKRGNEVIAEHLQVLNDPGPLGCDITLDSVDEWLRAMVPHIRNDIQWVDLLRRVFLWNFKPLTPPSQPKSTPEKFESAPFGRVLSKAHRQNSTASVSKMRPKVSGELNRTKSAMSQDFNVSGNGEGLISKPKHIQPSRHHGTVTPNDQQSTSFSELNTTGAIWQESGFNSEQKIHSNEPGSLEGLSASGGKSPAKHKRDRRVSTPENLARRVAFSSAFDESLNRSGVLNRSGMIASTKRPVTVTGQEVPDSIVSMPLKAVGITSEEFTKMPARRKELSLALQSLFDAPSAVSETMLYDLGDKFVDEKRKECGTTATLSTDPIVEALLEFPYIKVQALNVDDILATVEPNKTINLERILARPPPFTTVDEVMTTTSGPRKNKYQEVVSHAYGRRKQRNAKTVDSFRDFHDVTGRYGVGVKLYTMEKKS